MSKSGSSDHAAEPATGRPLRILHCMRSPVGGLFRHVRDLATAQAARGHAVGVMCDSATGGTAADSALHELAKIASLGVTRVDMGRQIGFADYAGYREAVTLGRKHSVDIVHGHGGKGGAYARLAARKLKQTSDAVAAFYTPHGGTLHFKPGTPAGVLYLGLERLLVPATDGLIFESQYSARIHAEKVGGKAPMRVVPNGLSTAEFTPHRPQQDAVDFLFVGELRLLKGVDVLLTALASLRQEHSVRALIVGDGPDRARFEALGTKLGLADVVVFAGAMPARQAFNRARAIVVPSRAESFPYIVLEAAAACLPLIATDVGGIPEIVAGTETRLVQADDVPALAQALRQQILHPELGQQRAVELQSAVRSRYTIDRMTDEVLTFYRSELKH
jgi:glycosyltransferase involved in cell wall biosynthesis